MKQLKDYSQLKIDDIIQIKPNKYYQYTLDYHNVNQTQENDLTILGIVKEIIHEHLNKSLKIKIQPISSNFGLMTDYSIIVSSYPNHMQYIPLENIHIISD